MDAIHIDIDQLAHYIQWKMDRENLSLREAAADMKVSAATLSRLLRKGSHRPQPDVKTLVRLMRWADVPSEKILAPAKSMPTPNSRRHTPEAIEVHLRADKNLSAEAAEAIGKMVRVAYAQFAKGQTKTRP